MAVTFSVGTSLPTFAAMPELTAHDVLSQVDDPRDVDSGDIDGDGDIDLVVAYGNPEALVAHVNIGNETFQPVPIGAGEKFNSVTLGDIDNDGDSDVVVASTGGIDLFLGASAFAGPGVQPLPGISERIRISNKTARHVVVADSDADGLLDVVVASATSMLMFRGTGTVDADGKPVFVESEILRFEGTPTGIISDLKAADIDGNGSIELLYTDSAGNRLGTLNYQGAGIWRDQTVATSLNGAAKVRVADLDADGHQDLLVLAPGQDHVVLLRQQTGGIFQPEPALTLADLADMSVADLNRDGAVDIAVIRGLAANDAMTLFENDGGARFIAATPAIGFDKAPRLVHLADVDRDGDADIVHAAIGPDAAGDDFVSLLRSSSRQRIASFEVAQPLLPTDGFASTVVVHGDFDNDGDLDIVAAGPAGLAGYEQLANGTMLPRTLPVSNPTQALATGDIDGDGDIDFFYAQEDAISWLRNDRGWNLSSIEEIGSVAGARISKMSGIDADSDGDIDLVSGASNGRVDRWLNDSMQFTRRVIFTAARPVVSFDIANLDADASPEVVVATGRPAGGAAAIDTFVAELDGTNTAPLTSGQPGSPLGDVIVSDVDDDGDNDIVRTFAAADSVVIFRNTSGVFAPSVLDGGPALGIRQIRAADTEGDGDTDLVASMTGFNAVVVYNSVGAGRYTRRFVTVQGNTFAEPVDLDDDGDIDLLADRNGQLHTMKNPMLHRGIGFGHQLVRGELDLPDGLTAPRFLAGDLDLDGADEIVVLNLALSPPDTRRSVSIIEHANQLGQFDVIATVPIEGAIRNMALADLDRDKDLDIVLSGVNQPVSWIRNDGGNNFTPLPLGDPSDSVAVADFDLDGVLDLVTARTVPQPERLFLKGSGDGTFSIRVTGDGNASTALQSATADLDADGDVDIVEIGVNALVMVRNNGLDGAGLPSFDTFNVLASDDLGSLALGDIDGDGDVDAVYSLAQAGSVWLALNVGGQLESGGLHRLLTPAGDEAKADTQVALADIDNDGDLDVSYGSLRDTTGNREPGFGVLENLGQIEFGIRRFGSPLSNGLPWDTRDRAVLLDINRDARLDMVYVSADKADTGIEAERATWSALNCGGMLQADALRLTDIGGSRITDGGQGFVAGIEITHRGRSGDAPLVLHSLPIALSTGDGNFQRPLTTAEARSAIATLTLRLDDGDGLPATSPGDALVREFIDVALSAPDATVPGLFDMQLAAGVANPALVTLAPGESRTYWVDVRTTPMASRVPGVERLFFEFRDDAPVLAEPAAQALIATTAHCALPLRGARAPAIIPVASSARARVILEVDQGRLDESQRTVVSVSARTLVPVTGEQRLVVAFTSSNQESPDAEALSPMEIVISDGASQGTNSVQIATIDDDFAENDEDLRIYVASAPDGGLSGIDGEEDPSELFLPLLSDDVVGVQLSSLAPLPLQTSEVGGIATFDIRLSSQPREEEGEVGFSISSSDESEGRVSVDRVIFTPENWNQLQTVSVIGQDDADRDGNVTYTILLINDDGELQQKGQSLRYADLDPEDLEALNLDDDEAPVEPQIFEDGFE
jgi:hypothetical protein